MRRRITAKKVKEIRSGLEQSRKSVRASRELNILWMWEVANYLSRAGDLSKKAYYKGVTKTWRKWSDSAEV